MPDLFRGNNCTILETRHVERNNSSFVQVTFRDKTSVREEQGGWRHLEGTVLLDPEHLYVVKEARLSGRILGDVSCDVVIEHEYRKENTGCVIPVKRTMGVTYRNGDFTRSETTDSEFFWEERPDIPERDFTLSAFGLPEPPGVTWERPTPWWLYGIIICFSLIILSGILYRVAARWRTQAAKPQTR